MKTTVKTTFVHECPYRDELDVGEIVIEWDGFAPELHHLAAYLDTFQTVKDTHECITQNLADHLGADVTTRWATAGLVVEVHAVPGDESV